ncbi:MAG: MBL fold metallo-hydrolase [Planctomycetota bacterium]
MVELAFHGAAGTVTGSRFLLRHAGRRLLVDCGLFQGRKELRERNWDGPAFAPGDVDAVALTHAHIDHSGYLPRLGRLGFKGPVYATPATADIADLLLRDSAHIQEEDAEYANRKGFSKHQPAKPLYTTEDAEHVLRQFEVVDFGQWVRVGRGMRFRFVPAGHILGSGFVELECERKGREPLTVLFSGDVGRYDAPLVADPSAPPACDVLVIESTYGDRDHGEASIPDQLEALLRQILATRGTLLFPSFAVGRAQQLLVLLNDVMRADPELRLPVHLDSPMAVDTTKIYARYPEEDGLESLRMLTGDRTLFGRHFFLHRTVDESIRLNSLDGPRVVISSSGMLTGGRILHHVKRLLPDERNVLALPGYQAPGTRGWRLEQGEPQLKLHGKLVPVRARIAKISGLSAHADRDQLLRWVGDLPAPKRTFVVHGDGGAPEALAALLRDRLGHTCEVPEHGQSFDLSAI